MSRLFDNQTFVGHEKVKFYWTINDQNILEQEVYTLPDTVTQSIVYGRQPLSWIKIMHAAFKAKQKKPYKNITVCFHLL